MNQCVCVCVYVCVCVQGRIQDFHLGGGGAKDYMRKRILWAQTPKSLSAGVQGPLKGPGSSRVF